MPDEAQPAAPDTGEGQGADGGSEALYAEFLDGVPNEYHEALTEKLKSKDAEFTKRFQGTAEKWKPYEELGITDLEPDQLGGWLNLDRALNEATGGNEEAKQAVQEWWEGMGEQLGFYEGNQNGESPDGETAEDILDLTPDQIQKMVEERVAKATTPLMERLDQQEQERLQAEATQEAERRISELRAENPNLTDEDQEDILALALIHGQDSDDPIGTGFEKFKRVVARGETDLFAQKLEQPGPAESGGQPNTAAPAITSDNVKELALERMRQASAI